MEESNAINKVAESSAWILQNLTDWFSSQGLEHRLAEIIAWIVIIAGILVAAWVCNFIAQKVILRVISFVVRKSQTKWDDALQDRKVFIRFSHLAPILIIYLGAGALPPISNQIQSIAIIYTYLIGMLIPD